MPKRTVAAVNDAARELKLDLVAKRLDEGRGMPSLVEREQLHRAEWRNAWKQIRKAEMEAA